MQPKIKTTSREVIVDLDLYCSTSIFLRLIPGSLPYMIEICAYID